MLLSALLTFFAPALPLIKRRGSWIWVDLENTPHVLFLEPLITELREKGCDVRITAKPQSQTVELAAIRNLSVTAVGAGDFAGIAKKLIGGGLRSLQLMSWVLRQRSRPRDRPPSRELVGAGR